MSTNKRLLDLFGHSGGKCPKNMVEKEEDNGKNLFFTFYLSFNELMVQASMVQPSMDINLWTHLYSCSITKNITSI